MALLAMASARSPGLTTAAVTLGLAWPKSRQVFLAELDPDGGTIAGRHAANPDPGLKTLAAAGRHYLSPGLVTSQLQTLPTGLPVLMSPASPDRCTAALGALNPVGLGATLRAIPDFDVIADCGRIDSSSPALPVVREADAVIFVVRPSFQDIIGLRGRLETLELPSTTRAGIVVVKEGPHCVEDVAAAFTLPVVGTLEWDPRAASAINDGRRQLRPSKLIRTAEALAASLVSQLNDQDPLVRVSTGPDAALDPRDAGSPDASSHSPEMIPSPDWTAPGDRALNRPSARWGAAL
jgi:hypothetical protein